MARQFLTPYGVEFVDLAELERVYIFDGYGYVFRAQRITSLYRPGVGVSR